MISFQKPRNVIFKLRFKCKETSIKVVREHFSMLVIVWIMLIITFWRLGMNDFGAALVGAGPFGLYYIYEEIVKNPDLKANSRIEYIKGVGTDNSKDPEFVIPIIDVYIEVENRGNQTARNCESNISLDDTNYRGRWTAGQPLEKIDIHPKSTRKMSLMRIIPTTHDLRKVGSSVDDAMSLEDLLSSLESQTTQSELDDVTEEGIDEEYLDASERDGQTDQELKYEEKTKFGNVTEGINYVLTDNFGSIDHEEKIHDPVDIAGLSLYTQIPYDLKHQEVVAESDDFPLEEPLYWFVGKNIEPRKEYDLKVSITGENYGKEILQGTVDIQYALENAEWETTNSKYQSLRTEFERYGWKNK